MISVSLGSANGEDEREICVEVNNEDLKGLSIGDEVIITIRGLVESLSAGRDIDDTESPGFECPASIEVHIQSHKVKKVGSNQFEKLVSEEEDENEGEELSSAD